MGEIDITNKLKSFLVNSLDEESQVVYLMVEIRKLIEQENSNTAYPVLKFYCDWCVHSKKDKTTRQIHDIMQKVYENVMYLNESNDTFFSVHEIQDFVEMKKLKEEMDNFFAQHTLPDFLFLTSNWENFYNLLVGVLVDQPLENPHPKIKSFYFKPLTPPNTAEVEIEYESKPAKYTIFSIKRGRVIGPNRRSSYRP